MEKMEQLLVMICLLFAPGTPIFEMGISLTLIQTLHVTSYIAGRQTNVILFVTFQDL